MKTRRSLRSLFGNAAVAAFLGLSLAVSSIVAGTATASAATGLFVPPGGSGGTQTQPALRTILNVNSAQNPEYATSPFNKSPIIEHGTLVVDWWYGCRVNKKPGYFFAALVLPGRLEPKLTYRITNKKDARDRVVYVGPYVRDSGTTVIHSASSGEHLYLELNVTQNLDNLAESSNCQWHVRIQTPAADADSTASAPAGTTILNVTNATYNPASDARIPSVNARSTMTARWWYNCAARGSNGTKSYFIASLISAPPTDLAYGVTPGALGEQRANRFVSNSGITLIHAQRGVNLLLAVIVTRGCRWQIKVQSP